MKGHILTMHGKFHIQQKNDAFNVKNDIWRLNTITVKSDTDMRHKKFTSVKKSGWNIDRRQLRVTNITRANKTIILQNKSCVI